MSPRPAIICVTPVRNEAWILDHFLAAASTWADHIVLLDQQSTDATPAIAAKWPKVRLLRLDDTRFDEAQRRNALLQAARAIPASHRLLVSLDADEFLTADTFCHPEWKTLLQAPPGTTALCRWINLYDGLQRAHICGFSHLLAYMDDERPIDEYFIHGPRLPLHTHGRQLQLNHIKVLHHQYLNWARMKAKHRWYQCIETMQNPAKSAIALYRQYHHMDSPCSRYDPIDPAWFGGYAAQGVDITSFDADPHPWFNGEVLRLMAQAGARRFSRLAIWDLDWVAEARLLGLGQPARFADPRSAFEKRVHAWLSLSQAPNVIFSLKNRLISLGLRRLLRW